MNDPARTAGRPAGGPGAGLDGECTGPVVGTFAALSGDNDGAPSQRIARRPAKPVGSGVWGGTLHVNGRYASYPSHIGGADDQVESKPLPLDWGIIEVWRNLRPSPFLTPNEDYYLGEAR